MGTNNHIAYYCFNKHCSGSVYFSNTIRIADLPLNIKTLSANHYCDLCHSRMVSMLDIEIKHAACRHEESTIHNPVFLR